MVQHAEQVMNIYTTSKSVLEFRFAGEKGLGAGVTASFYSAVAAELQRRAVNVEVKPLAPPPPLPAITTAIEEAIR